MTTSEYKVVLVYRNVSRVSRVSQSLLRTPLALVAIDALLSQR